MSPGLIIYSHRKPLIPSDYSIDPLNSPMNIGDCVVGDYHDYIRYVGHQFQLQTVKKLSGIVYTFGWYPVEELLNKSVHSVKPYLCKGLRDFRIRKNGWVLPCDTHDFSYEDVFIALWISILEANGIEYSVYEIDSMGNITKHETKPNIQLMEKIENLTDDTNPLYNPNAVIVVRILSRKTRYIACNQIPANPRRIKHTN